MRNGGVTSNKFDIRALSPGDTSVIPLLSPEPGVTPLLSPEPDSTMSTVTLVGDTVTSTATAGTLVATDQDDRTISACSTLDGDDDDLLSDVESLL